MVRDLDMAAHGLKEVPSTVDIMSARLSCTNTKA
jgi:hypothetical protein